MGNIKYLGPVEMFECCTCKERYVGPCEDKQTKTWLTSHRRWHTQSGSGVWCWEKDQ
jgi:hypothetical protein